MSREIDRWKLEVKTMLDNTTLSIMEFNFLSLTTHPFYDKFKEEKRKDSYYRFGQHLMNTLNCCVPVPEIYYTNDEDIVLDFIACYLYEVGIKLKEGGLL